VDASTRPVRKVVSEDQKDEAKSIRNWSPSARRQFFIAPIKMNWEEKSGKFWQTYGRHVLVIVVVVLLAHDVFGTHGYLAMRQKQLEIHKVSTVLDQLNKQNALLEQDVQDLKSDPQTIRKIAREELGLAEPGEIIIKLPTPEAPAAAAKP
jgi:cell division protein FtsL